MLLESTQRERHVAPLSAQNVHIGAARMQVRDGHRAGMGMYGVYTGYYAGMYTCLHRYYTFYSFPWLRTDSFTPSVNNGASNGVCNGVISQRASLISVRH